MSPRPLKAAVIGVGHLGRVHARIYAENPGSELAFVVDADRERAEDVAREYGCLAVPDASELPGDVEAVSVVVPTRHHRRVAVPLLERGVACLVEKPLASSAEEAREILGAAERGGALLTVGHVERFQPGMRRLTRMGLEPRFIECHRLTPFSFRSMDVGVVHDLMIHDLDLVLHLMGRPVESSMRRGGRSSPSTRTSPRCVWCSRGAGERT